MAHKVNQWLTYNGNEYTINGKTYRNLEEQVLHNKNLSQKNRDDIDALDARLSDDEERIEHLEDISTFRVKYNVTTGICDKTMGEIIKAKNNGALILLSTSNNTNTEYYTITNFNTNGTKHYIQAYDIGGDVEYPWLNILVSNECDDNEYPTLTKTTKYKDVYICEWNVTTYNDVWSAYYDDGIRDIMVSRGGYWYYLATVPYQGGGIHFSNVYMTNTPIVYMRSVELTEEDGWQVGDTIATTTSIGNGSTRYIPTTSAVKDYVDTEIANNDKVFIATQGTTTEAEYTQAETDGKLIFLKTTSGLQYYQSYTTSTYRYFFNINPSNNNESYVRFTRASNTYSGPSSVALQITSNKKSTPQTSSLTTYYPDFSYINNYEKLLKITFNLNTTPIYSSDNYTTLNTAYTNGRPIIGVDNNNSVYQLSSQNIGDGGTYAFQCIYTPTVSPIQTQKTIFFYPDNTKVYREENILIAPLSATSDGTYWRLDNGVTWALLTTICKNNITPDIYLNGTNYPPIRLRYENETIVYKLHMISPIFQSSIDRDEYSLLGYEMGYYQVSPTGNIIGTTMSGQAIYETSIGAR